MTEGKKRAVIKMGISPLRMTEVGHGRTPPWREDNVVSYLFRQTDNRRQRWAGRNVTLCSCSKRPQRPAGQVRGFMSVLAQQRPGLAWPGRTPRLQWVPGPKTRAAEEQRAPGNRGSLRHYLEASACCVNEKARLQHSAHFSNSC